MWQVQKVKLTRRVGAYGTVFKGIEFTPIGEKFVRSAEAIRAFMIKEDSSLVEANENQLHHLWKIRKLADSLRLRRVDDENNH